MSEPAVTWILHNWAKRPNMREVIASLRAQTVPCRIFLWNNHPKVWVDRDVDWVVNSTKNRHLGSYFYMASQADTPYVGRIDDDLKFTDKTVLADVLEYLEQSPITDRQIVGSQGVKLNGLDYERARHIRADSIQEPTHVDIVKGRLMLMRREANNLVNWNPGTVHIDLTMSFDLAQKNRRTHRVLPAFRKRLVDLPESGTDTYSSRPTHMPERNALAAAWMASLQ